MGPLFTYSLVPVIGVSLLLCFTAALRGRNARGLALYCLSLSLWSGALFFISIPATSQIGERFAAIGAFNAAGYLHAAWDLTRQRDYRLVFVAYFTALCITLMGAAWPGILYGPRAMVPGPLFWPAMALAAGAAALPMWTLARAYITATRADRSTLRGLFLSGALIFTGGMGSAMLLAHGIPLPVGMYLALAGLLILANVIRAHEPPGERRLLERSLLYAAMAAFLSAGFLFGIMSLMPTGSDPLLREYRLGTLFLLFMAALAFEPLRQQVQDWLGRHLLRDATSTHDLARELATQEQRANQAERLAQLGSLVSAVAHEVRNPLGVLAAHLKLLERQGGPPETIAAMREQIDRAGHFVEDLLRYGRPRPLELRVIDLVATVQLAFSTAKQGLGLVPAEAPVFELNPPDGSSELFVEADQSQIEQLLVILFENAMLALEGAPQRLIRVTLLQNGDRLCLRIDDSGPGIPEALRTRLFQPFVTGRRREGPHAGTGLGLAIARGIVERHGGTIEAGASDLGGARFELRLPQHQPVLAAASAALLEAEKVTAS